ncbi:MAG: hypothetical protein QOE70_5380 [Chthoniobacter sp.]|jgi:AcrR family transcriptional regulator|nr:hypothetical protein [Chthoniobacter sp.]
MKSNTRLLILQRAGRLLFSQGLATGIDRTTRECQTAKMTIYQHFTNKDGLICAILQGVQSALNDKILAITGSRGIPPNVQLESVFNIVCYGMSDPEIMAGLGVRALTEFPRPDHPVHLAGLKLDRAILRHLEPLCGQAAIEDSETAARQLLLIAKGCFLMVPLLGVSGSRVVARELARSVLSQSGEAPASAAPSQRAGHPTTHV